LARNGYLDYTPIGDLTSGGMPPTITDRTSIYPDRLNGWFRDIPQGAPTQPVLFPVGEQYTGFGYDLGAAFITATSQNAEACYRFIKTISQHPELFSTMPVRRSMLANPAFQAATNPDNLALFNRIEQVLNDPHTIPFQIFGNRFNLSDFLIQYWLLH